MRLIDADARLKELTKVKREVNCNLPEIVKLFNGLIDWIKEAPTVDAVPVVRCKDCKHYKVEGGQCPADNTSDPFYSWIPAPDWFCADGEAKEPEA